MTQLASDVWPPCSQGITWCTSHHDDGRPHRPQPPSRAATARRRPSGITRVARPTSSGWPFPSSTIGTTAASQHSIRSDSGAQRAAEVEACGAGAVLQVLQPHEHVQVGAPSAAGAHVGVVEHVAARVGERFGLPLRVRA